MRDSLLPALGFAATVLMSGNMLASAQTQQSSEPVLAELFTSQSCSSCPAAERLFNHLADDENVVAIQWHVDYWDNLVHGRAGKWKDPYSSAANTQRQRDYNFALRGTGSVYTPQAVVAGVMETTGSRAKRVSRMIASAPAAEAAIRFEMENDRYNISVTPLTSAAASIQAETMIVMLVKEDSNDIAAGENKGLSVKSRNVAVSADTLGAWTGTMETYRTEMMPEGYSCAVIVQERAKGRVLGASYCPG